MAFTGTATFEMVATGICRITGLSLAAGAAGTISLHAGTGEQKLPVQFQANQQELFGRLVGLDDALDITTKPATAVTTAIPVEVVKTGDDADSFLATLTNNHATLASPGLEIYVKFHT